MSFYQIGIGGLGAAATAEDIQRFIGLLPTQQAAVMDKLSAADQARVLKALTAQQKADLSVAQAALSASAAGGSGIPTWLLIAAPAALLLLGGGYLWWRKKRK